MLRQPRRPLLLLLLLLPPVLLLLPLAPVSAAPPQLRVSRLGGGAITSLPGLASVDPASGIGVATGDMPDGAALTQEFQNAGAKLRDDPMSGTPDVVSMPDGMAVVEGRLRSSPDSTNRKEGRK